MRVRRVDAAGDMQFGQGQANFFRDVPDAVAQIVLSRLQLYQGEFFLDTRDGTPWRTQVLGKYTGPTRDMVIRSRILGTPGCTAITDYNSAVNRDTRGFAAQATINTTYGATTVAVPANVAVTQVTV